MNTQDKPWLKSYKLGPYKLDPSLAPFPEIPLFQLLDETAQKHPGQTAILFEGRSLKYQQLKNQVDRLAAALAGMGLEKGDRVCLFLPNCIEFVLCYWAILKAGGVVVPVSILHTEAGLLHEVGTSQSRLIICREEHLDRVLAIKAQSPLERVIVTPTEGYGRAEISTPLPASTHELGSLLRAYDPEPPQVEIDPQKDLCELAFTGGATGTPKGVMLTHFNRVCSTLQGLPWIMKPILPGIAGKSSVLVAIPLFHAFGNYVHLTAVHLGLRILLLPDPRDTERMVATIRTHRPFLIPGVPTQFMRMAEAGLSRLSAMLLSGSAPLPAEVAQAIKRKTGMPISEGYGLTETSTISHFNLSAFSKITGFMAKEIPGIGVPCPDTDCRLVDPQTGADVPVGQPGEVILRGPQIMQGYWPEPGSGLSSEGWMHTGDIASMDEEGYFHLVDRIKDMVNISGMKVYTTHVDEVLFKHPSVLMAAAFGVPDPQVPGSERVMAVIQLKEGQEGDVRAADIQDFCRDHLPPYAVPTYVEFRDRLPLTVSEKVFKKVLRDEAVARLKKEGHPRR
jgi:long-chain acyl-CoA synthetase